MKRTAPSKKASAIIVSDLHLTDSTPACRIDDNIAAQKQKLLFLQDLSNKNNHCPILCGGDVFDRWKASPWLSSMAFEYLPKPFICIPGQHDLPGHSLSSYEKSALQLVDLTCKDVTVLLEQEKKVVNDMEIIGLPFGTMETFDPSSLPKKSTKKRILMLHELTWKGKSPHWDERGLTDKKLIHRFGDYFDLIITGDNHSSWFTEDNNCKVVNPGSMMRMSIDQRNHQPTCYLYYKEDNSLKTAHIPILKGAISIEGINTKEEKETRIQAYIERIQGDWEIGMSFENNLKAFFSTNKISKKVREIIWEHLEMEKN